MGILDRFRKEEKYDKETGRFGPVRREIKELTREEQMEPTRRQQPWQTPRGKRVIKDIRSGVQRVDRAVVRYNRRQPIRKSYTSPSFGFGYPPQTTTTKKKRSGSKTKYKIISGKAYPIAGTSKKKTTRKRKRQSGFGSFDMFDNYRGFKL